MSLSMRRVQMKTMYFVSKHRTEIFTGFCIIVAVIMVLKAAGLSLPSPSKPDARYIDLSARRQEQLINDFIAKDAENKKLIQEQNEEDIKKFEEMEKKHDFEYEYDEDKEINEQLELLRKQDDDTPKAILSPQEHEQRIKEAETHIAKLLSQSKIGDKINVKVDAPGDKNVGLSGGPGHCAVYDLSQEIHESYECIHIKIRPNPMICIYPPDIDIHISGALHRTGMWEQHMYKEMQNILYSDKEIALIDIGANIGVYSVTAATMGHKVLAVEPFIDNIKHIQQSLIENKKKGKQEDLYFESPNFVLVQNAISDSRHDFVSLLLDSKNQGGIQLDRSEYGPCYGSKCPPQVRSIFMDDLLEVCNFKKAVIKIDIEGHEHRAFRHADKLLTTLYVPYIFMEWMKLREYYGVEDTRSEDKTLVWELVDLLAAKGYKAYSFSMGVVLNNNHWYSWPDDVLWKHELEDFVDE